MVRPAEAFTMRYYEFRQLTQRHSIKTMMNQMTFAVNRRRYERWRDVDTESFETKWRHAFVRRCASFWSNQRDGDVGWDGKASEFMYLGIEPHKC